LRIFENAEPIEADALNELEQSLKPCFRFAGKTDDKRGPKRDARNTGTQFLDQPFDMRARSFPAHSLQHCLVDMLKWHIDITRDLAALRNRGDQFVAPVRRMRVKQSH